MKFDPESYTITIRKEDDEGEVLYVGRVAEFPNISAFEDTFEATRDLILDSIQTLKRIADESHVELPLPYPAPLDEFSGRVTLRLSKSLHAKVSRMAAQEDVSVNQFLVTAVATYVGEADGISKVISEAVNYLGNIVTETLTNVITWKRATFLFDSSTPSEAVITAGGYPGQKYINYQTAQFSGATHDV